MDLTWVYIIVILIFVYAFYKFFYNDNIVIVSVIDNRPYKVQNAPNRIYASTVLSKIRINLEALIKELNKKYPDDYRVININQRINLDSIMETPSHMDYTSYSLNKGEEISFCIRDKKNYNNFYPFNVMMFVAIHELSHIASNGIGHDQEFYENFKWLLEEANQLGIYKKENFNDKPQMYCGINITNELI